MHLVVVLLALLFVRAALSDSVIAVGEFTNYTCPAMALSGALVANSGACFTTVLDGVPTAGTVSLLSNGSISYGFLCTSSDTGCSGCEVSGVVSPGQCVQPTTLAPVYAQAYVVDLSVSFMSSNYYSDIACSVQSGTLNTGTIQSGICSSVGPPGNFSVFGQVTGSPAGAPNLYYTTDCLSGCLSCSLGGTLLLTTGACIQVGPSLYISVMASTSGPSPPPPPPSPPPPPPASSPAAASWVSIVLLLVAGALGLLIFQR